MNTIDHTIAALLPELVELRHELHRHPEIRFEEHRTSDRIARFLDEAGVEYQRGFAKGTGIVAIIEGDGPQTQCRGHGIQRLDELALMSSQRLSVLFTVTALTS